MSEPHLSARLLGERVVELEREGAFWRVSVVQLDGAERRQVGGVSLSAREFPLYIATLRAMAAYAQQVG